MDQGSSTLDLIGESLYWGWYFQHSCQRGQEVQKNRQSLDEISYGESCRDQEHKDLLLEWSH